MRARSALAAAALAVPFLAGAAWPPSDRSDDADSSVLFRFASSEIEESSGLVWRDGLVVTTNDSGDEGRVFAVDPGTGETVGTTTWVSAGGDSDAPVDVEALAPAGPGAVWVGDIGDNLRARDVVAAYRVPVGRGDRTATPTPVLLRHPDGPRDAETLLAHPRTGRLYVVTKGVLGGVLAAAPTRLRPGRVHALRDVGPVLALATDGAFLPDGRHLVLRGYARAVVYAWPSLRPVGEVDLPAQEQGEGLAVTPDGRLLLSSEGLRQPVLEVTLPPRVRRALRAPDASASPGSGASAGAEPTPTAGPNSAPPSASGFPEASGAGDEPDPGDAGGADADDRSLMARAPVLLVGLGVLVGLVALGGGMAALRARRRR